MTYEQFWEQDVELVKFYREAWQLKQQVRNQDLWLQGAYIYEAILDAAPVFHPFAKKGTKPVPYREQPYELFTKKTVKTEAEQDAEDKRERQKVKAMLQAWAIEVNNKFEKKGGEENGS